MARNLDIDTSEELNTMLTFFHDLGLIIHYAAMRDGYSTLDKVLANTVVLSPQWLAHKFRHVAVARPSEFNQVHMILSMHDKYRYDDSILYVFGKYYDFF